MSLFYLIRHSDDDWLKRSIAGRIPGVHLNEKGKKQVQELAQHLSVRDILCNLLQDY